jgi:glucosamine--fructose-6-phosphate aminotransferase (isomerizing)
VFADRHARLVAGDGIQVILLDKVHNIVAPIMYTIPLQL